MEAQKMFAWAFVGLAALGLVMTRREKTPPVPEFPVLPPAPKYSGLISRLPPAAPLIAPHGVEAPVASVSDAQTLEYQLDRIIDDLQHLETEHLPAQGIIFGKPCDCVSKGARSLRFHAQETIPIAARQGKDTHLFAEMAQWADHFVRIGTAEEVATGRHGDEFLRGAGEASNFRKRTNAYAAECKPCQARAKLAALSPEVRAKVVAVAKKLEAGEMTVEQAKAEVSGVVGG